MYYILQKDWSCQSYKILLLIKAVCTIIKYSHQFQCIDFFAVNCTKHEWIIFKKKMSILLEQLNNKFVPFPYINSSLSFKNRGESQKIRQLLKQNFFHFEKIINIRRVGRQKNLFFLILQLRRTTELIKKANADTKKASLNS